MKIRIANVLLAAMTLFAGNSVFARQISESEALQLAGDFQRGNTSIMRVSPSGAAPTLKLAYKSVDAKTSATGYYVFNRGVDNGFIVVAGDDRVRNVLGYSTNGSFDWNNLPDNMKWWLGQYQQEIAAFLATDGNITANPVATAGSVRKAPADRQTVAPLVTTRWNQDTPYNNMCPVVNGERSVTGCVATAMAQIMNYHKYPAKGTGSNSYTTSSYGTPVSCDFSSITFDWEHMLDTYNSQSPAVANQAVAQLMFACGASVYMDYSPDASSARDIPVTNALTEYFGYDKGLKLLNRSQFSPSDWEQTVYDEIAARRPVYYTGQANSGGHAFICDGYAGNGYFHFNWGWGGSSDGDFALSALNPDDQGIGSFEGGYNSDQAIIAGIQPNKGTPAYIPLELRGTFTYKSGKEFYISELFSLYPKTITAKIGVMIASASSDEIVKSIASNRSVEMPGANLITGNIRGLSFNFYLTVDNLPAGEYKVYPAFQYDNGPWERLRPPYGEAQYVKLIVDANGNKTYSNPDPEIAYDLTVVNFGVTEDVYQNSSATISISVRNNADADYNGTITLKLSDAAGNVVQTNNLGITIAANQTFNGGVSIQFAVAPGTYNVSFFDKAGKPIPSGKYTVTVLSGSAPVEPEILYVKSVTPAYIYRNESNTLTFQFRNNTNTNYRTGVYINLLDKATKKELDYNGFNGLTINAKTTVNYSLQGIEFNVPAGEYLLEVCNPSNEPMHDTPFEISVYERSGDLWYGVNGDNSAAYLAPNYSTQYTGTDGAFEIPARVTLGGKSLPVTGIADKVFAANSGLKAIVMRSADVLSFADNSFTGVSPDLAFYVPAQSYDAYNAAFGGIAGPVYASIEKMIYTIDGVDPEEMKVGEKAVVNVIFTPGKHVNTDVITTGAENGLFRITTNAVAGDRMEIEIEALKAGNGTLTVESAEPLSAHRFSIPVSIAEAPAPPAEGLVLSATNLKMIEGDETVITATLYPGGIETSDVTWTSSNPAVATVDEGCITAIAYGRTVITAVSIENPALKAECIVDVSMVNGIDEADSDTVTVTVAAKDIIVKGAAAGSAVKVYSVTGSLAASGISDGGEVRLTAGSNGVYIVTAGNRVVKVVVK